MQIDRPIAIAITLFIILLLIFFLALPEYNTFRNLQTQLNGKKAEFNAQYDYYAAITKTYYDLQSKKDDIDKIDDALPSSPDLSRIIYYLQETARDNGLVVKDLYLSKSSSAGASTATDASVGKIKDIVFSADLIGDYGSLESFIMSLEESSRIFEVTNISFNSSSKSPYVFGLQIKTYSY